MVLNKATLISATAALTMATSQAATLLVTGFLDNDAEALDNAPVVFFLDNIDFNSAAANTPQIVQTAVFNPGFESTFNGPILDGGVTQIGSNTISVSLDSGRVGLQTNGNNGGPSTATISLGGFTTVSGSLPIVPSAFFLQFTAANTGFFTGDNISDLGAFADGLENGDLTNSGGFADITAIGANGAFTERYNLIVTSSEFTPSPVPEPSGLALLGLGAAASLLRRHRPKALDNHPKALEM